jgi:hypothetical protein
MANNSQLTGHDDLLEVVIGEVPEKGLQYRMSISEFREMYYLSVREWYAAYENTFAPSNNGFTMPYNMSSVNMLYKALQVLLSEAEVLPDIIADKTHILDLMRKSALVGQLSKLSAIPADILLEKITEITFDEVTDEFKIKVDVKGSPWLTK